MPAACFLQTAARAHEKLVSHAMRDVVSAPRTPTVVSYKMVPARPAWFSECAKKTQQSRRPVAGISLILCRHCTHDSFFPLNPRSKTYTVGAQRCEIRAESDKQWLQTGEEMTDAPSEEEKTGPWMNRCGKVSQRDGKRAKQAKEAYSRTNSQIDGKKEKPTLRSGRGLER